MSSVGDRVLGTALWLGLASCAAGPEVPDSSGPSEAVGAEAPFETVLTGNGTYAIDFRTLPPDVPLNEPFEVEFRLRRTDGAPLGEVRCEVDATMPAHRHGMLRAPTVESHPDGSFRARGMLLHMTGDWVFTFDVRRGGRTERARWALTL